MGGGAGGVLGAATGAEGAPGPRGPAAIADSETRRALAAMTVNVPKPGILAEALRSERRGSRRAGSSVLNGFLHRELRIRPHHRVGQHGSRRHRA